MTDIFFKEFCRFDNLFTAWLHVRSRARRSSSKDIRDAAEDFEQKSNSALRSIQSKLVKRSYKFPPSEGVLKDKAKRKSHGKLPRPIVLADIESRIVQRALLQCLQPRDGAPLSRKLKKLKEINSSDVNFGGTPDGGVPKAIKFALLAVNDGHTVYFKSDIAAFFTKVPHQFVVDFLKAETGDKEFVATFESALKIQLKNVDQLKEYLHLFPDDEIGVAQGSALSALAGNIFLQEVDCVMKKITDIRFIRYIDDVIIFAKSNEMLQKSKSTLSSELKKRSLSLYEPAKHPDKAAQSHIRNGLEYLGCLIRRNQIEPARSTKEKLLKKVTAEITFGKSNITKLLATPAPTRTREAVLSQTIANVDEIVRGWANSFRFVNSRLPFSQMDGEIRKLLFGFINWFEAQKFSSEAQRMRCIGAFQITDVEYRPIEDF